MVLSNNLLTLLRRILLLLLAVTLTTGMTVGTADASVDWRSEEGDRIINGLSSDTVPQSVGEVSVVSTNETGEDTSYSSATSSVDTEVSHLSAVLLGKDTAAVKVLPGDTVDVGVKLTNRGNGFDTYALSGDFADTTVEWDTEFFLDTDRDSSANGEPATDRVENLPLFGEANDDTGLVIRVTVPDTATVGSTEAYDFRSASIRSEDPVPGLDTFALTLRVIDTGLVGITSPANGHDTKIRSITVSGTSSFTDTGDSVAVSVNGTDTKATGVTGGGNWSIDTVPLKDMGDTVRAFLYHGDTGASLRDTDLINVNFDPIADTFPQNFSATDTEADTVTLGWSAFSDIPGDDPDTGTGFQEYLVAYDTGGRPDSSSVLWDATDDPALGSLGQDTTAVNGLTAGETYVFRVGYRDRAGNISVLSPSDTATPDTKTPANIFLRSVRNTSVDSAVLADGSGTIGIDVTWENTGQKDGVLSLDTDDLKVRDHEGNEQSGFDLSLRSDTEVTVPAKSNHTVSWWIDVPDTESRNRMGAYDVSYETSVERAFLNIAGLVTKITHEKDSLDAWSAGLGTFDLYAGVRNDNPVHDKDIVKKGENIAVMVQKGDSTFIDTPLVNPEYGFGSRAELRAAVTEANEKLESTLNETVSDNVMNISIWKESVGDTYIGSSESFNENVQVEVEKPDDASDLKVVKLLPDENEWYVIDDNPEVQGDRLTFVVAADVRRKASGFSVFRLVTGGTISKVGSADETIVYPNPFIPYDGDPETGEYGSGRGQGIYFATGRDKGFPAGTEVKIYTVTGELVAEKTIQKPDIIQWNAKTGAGDTAKSGVYVYRITTPDGSEKVGKLSIVR